MDISTVLMMAISDDFSNVDLAVLGLSQGYIPYDELIVALLGYYKNWLKEKERSNELYNTENEEIVLLSKISVKFNLITFKDIPQIKMTFVTAGGYNLSQQYPLDAKEYLVSPIIIERLGLIVDKFVNPTKYFDSQQLAEIMLFIRRNDPKSIRQFSVNILPVSEYGLLQARITKLIKSSSYENMLFCFGHRFLLHLHQAFMNKRWFDEVNKIEAAIDKANSFFNPKYKLSNSL